jgi:transcriptional regulator with XRE-family HTH domain
VDYLSMLDTQLRKAFGLRLRALRKQHNWTQKELAAKLNILFSQLNKYECGINVPPPEKLLEMAALFHTNVDYLLSGSPATDIPLHNQRLLSRFRALENFPSDDQETIIKIIDAFILKQRVEGALTPLDLISPSASNSTSTSSNPSDSAPSSRSASRSASRSNSPLAKPSQKPSVHSTAKPSAKSSPKRPRSRRSS